MITSAEIICLVVALLAGLGEYLHARRCRKVALLAFGPAGKPRPWTRAVPLLRVIALALLAWGFVQLWLLQPSAHDPKLADASSRRHLVIALDVSPSMQLADAGPEHRQTRAQRASEVVLSILDRADLGRLRTSVVVFYSGAKPVVVDTFDLAIIKNILNDLPLALAFSTGKTRLLDGVRESAALARDWAPGSTTLLIVSDGDTIPDTGIPPLPPAIRDSLVLGVGSNNAGLNIDGHLSRQDGSTLRQLAARLGGAYLDVNEKHVPTLGLSAYARSLPIQATRTAGIREWALAATGVGAFLLASLPVALAAAGSAWPAAIRSRPRQGPLSSSLLTEPIRS